MSEPKPGTPGTPGWTSQMDQSIAGSRDIGRMIAATHEGMILGGMSREEATKLSIVQSIGMTVRAIAEQVIEEWRRQAGE